MSAHKGFLVAVVFLVLAGCGSSAGVTVTVAGRSVSLPSGATVASLALRPRAGNLVDIEGKLLRRGAEPGRILLNGKAAAASMALHDGDEITLVAGRDHREPVSRQLVRVGEIANPQFFVAKTPGSETVVKGRVSHELVSVKFTPAGPAQAERAVALTFDDGPSPQYTQAILATLERLHVKATFFVIGYLADEYPGLVREELRAGMTVGNHSYNHPEVPPFDRLPEQLMADEIALGAASLQRAGADPKLFRPPAGSYSPAVVRAAQALGERIVLWSVDPTDWQPGTTAGEIVSRVLVAVKPGSIVILHDGGGNRSATLAALPAIVKGIRARHLRLVALTGS